MQQIYSALNKLMKAWTKLRFKSFRLLSLILLGREGGQAIVGISTMSDLEFANNKSVRDMIQDRKLLSEAEVQEYNCLSVPDCWRTMFSRCTAFPRRFAYILKDVVVGPDSGVVHTDRVCGGAIFVQSVGSINFLFQWGIQEVMRRAITIDCDAPICPMPNIGYYHDLFEGLIRVVKARHTFKNVKVLVAECRPRYIDEMLSAIGVQNDQIIEASSPVLVRSAVLIPRWADSGENLKEDVIELRDSLRTRLSDALPSDDKIYISRIKSRRPLANERGIEKILASKGFKVVYFEDISFRKQLQIIYAAKVIVAPHGAALANIIVAKRGAKVIELMTQDYANSCYGHIASSLGLDYVCLDADDSSFIEQIEMFINN